MSRFILSIFLLALIAGGCDDSDSSNNTQAYRQVPVKTKPAVAIVPIIDNTKNDYSWNLSDELSSSLYQRISQKNHLTLSSLTRAWIIDRLLTEKTKAKQLHPGSI